MTYQPRAGSVAARAIERLEREPSKSMRAKALAAAVGVDARQIYPHLKPAVEHGLVCLHGSAGWSVFALLDSGPRIDPMAWIAQQVINGRDLPGNGPTRA